MKGYAIDQIVFDGSTVDSSLKFDNYFFGRAVDSRESNPLTEIKSRCPNPILFRYEFSTRNFLLNSTVCHESTFEQTLKMKLVKGSVLLDGTTLNVVEIASILRTLTKLRRNLFSIIYFEPDKYSKKRGEPVFRDFDLSERVNPFSAAPFFSYQLDKDAHFAIFFLGFEGQRLDRAFEQLPVLNARYTRALFGIPAFKFGMEIDALSNNVGILSGRNVPNEVYYSGANSVYDTLHKLYEIKEKIGPEKRMFLIPTGTKPHAIAASLFANQYPETGIFYDFPEKKTGRTQDLGKGHLYQVQYRTG